MTPQTNYSQLWIHRDTPTISSKSREPFSKVLFLEIPNIGIAIFEFDQKIGVHQPAYLVFQIVVKVYNKKLGTIRF